MTCVEAATIYVDDSALPGGDGSDWTEARTSLGIAIATAAAGDQIWVAEGVYVPGLLETNTFRIANGVEIYGGFEGAVGTEGDFGVRDPENFVTVLSGDIGSDDITDPDGVVLRWTDINGSNTNHVITSLNTDESALLDGFTITAGQANGPSIDAGRGGGVFLKNASPTLTQLVISGNTSTGAGSGLSNDQGSPSLTDIIFSENGGGSRGGGMFSDEGAPALTNVIFSENSSDRGGGVNTMGGSISLQNTLFVGNHGVVSGGGMVADYRFIFPGFPVLSNVLFSGNTAGQEGGGMRNIACDPVLTNVTFSGNSAGVRGGGMSNEGETTFNIQSFPILQNCIFWGNDAGGSSDQIFSLSPSHATLSNCLVQGGCPEDPANCVNILETDPYFVDADGTDDVTGTLDDDLRLFGDSPAIDQGDNSADLDHNGPGNTHISDIPTDLGGAPRIRDATIDLGAYEFQFLLVNDVYVNDDANGANNGSDWNDAFNDLQDALIPSTSGTRIFVAEGLYSPGPSETDTFRLPAGVKLYGGFAGLPGTEGDLGASDPDTFVSVLSGDIGGDDVTGSKAVVTIAFDIVGQNTDNVVTALTADSSTLLQGFTITGGQADGIDPHNVGGGVRAGSSDLKIQEVVFSGNFAADCGGGLHISGGASPTFANLTFIGNHAEVFGGGLCSRVTSMRVSNSVFLGNRAASGGGMFNFGAIAPSLVNALFSGNVAIDVGGGIYNHQGGATVGFFIEPSYTNCVFSGNIAGDGGGAIYTQGPDIGPIIQNSILWGNIVVPAGDQVADGTHIGGNNAVAYFTESIIQDSGGSGAGWDSTIGIDGGGNLDLDPLFLDADGVDDLFGTLDDDLRLMAASPAINSGSNEADLDAGESGTETISDIPFDLDGNIRIAEGTVDRGPYEFPSTAPSLTPTLQSTPFETPVPTNTPISTNTPSSTTTPTLTTIVVNLTPTVTNTAGPEPSATTNFDAPPSADGEINSDDLIYWIEEIKDDGQPGDLLFDFSRFWKGTSQ